MAPFIRGDTKSRRSLLSGIYSKGSQGNSCFGPEISPSATFSNNQFCGLRLRIRVCVRVRVSLGLGFEFGLDVSVKLGL